MARLTPKPQPSPPDFEKRRSQRVLLVIPVEVAWTSKSGNRVEEPAETEIVSAHGALLRMKTSLAPGTQAEVRHARTGRTSEARVVSVGEPEKGGRVRLGFELDVPSQEFWGISIPPPRSHS